MSVSPTSEMGDMHVYLMRPVTSALRSEPSALQNLHRNSAAGLSQKIHYVNGPTLWYGWHGFETTFLVSSLTADSTLVHFNVIVW